MLIINAHPDNKNNKNKAIMFFIIDECIDIITAKVKLKNKERQYKMSNIANWSSIDDNNNRVPPDGWPEHQSPSSVNNSARAMMGALRRSYLEQPYFNPGGTIQYVDQNTFQVKDTNEITDFSQFYTLGRRLKFVSVNGTIYGNVGRIRYSGGVAEIKCTIDSGASIDPLTTTVLCGLTPQDAGEVVGRLPVGMILPYTAMTLPPGFLYANGSSFDPNIYTELAKLWKTGEDEYLYGQEVVGGAYWPKTPDVRGQFPRYLDMGAGIDPDSETRIIGSTQDDAIRNITGSFTANNYVKFASNSVVDGAFFVDTAAQSGEGIAGGSYGNAYPMAFDASKVVNTADENRPTNMAFPALIVAWHGITPAENISIQDVLTAFNQMQGSIDQIYDAKTTAISDLEQETENITQQARTIIQNASNMAVETVNTTTLSAITSVEGKADIIKGAGDEEITRIQNQATTELENLQTYVGSFNPDNYANTDLLNVSQTSGFRKLYYFYTADSWWYKIFEETNTATGIKKYWCEQGGRVDLPLHGANQGTYNFPRAFNITPTTIIISPKRETSSGGLRVGFGVGNRTSTSFYYDIRDTTGYDGASGFFWEAKGYCDKP